MVLLVVIATVTPVDRRATSSPADAGVAGLTSSIVVVADLDDDRRLLLL